MKHKKFEIIEENAKDAPVKDVKWYGSDISTPQQDLHDIGVGQKIILRPYKYKLFPGITRPTKEQILTPEYMKTLHTLLWADELRMIDEPRVVFDDESFTIFVPCQPKTGSNILEKTKLIQEYAAEGHRK